MPILQHGNTSYDTLPSFDTRTVTNPRNKPSTSSRMSRVFNIIKLSLHLIIFLFSPCTEIVYKVTQGQHLTPHNFWCSTTHSTINFLRSHLGVVRAVFPAAIPGRVNWFIWLSIYYFSPEDVVADNLEQYERTGGRISDITFLLALFVSSSEFIYGTIVSYPVSTLE